MSSTDTAKHILITGGSGFIGRSLCHTLVDLGYSLSVLTRDPQHADAKLRKEGVSDGVAFITDLSEMNGGHCHAVINLAGEPLAKRWTAARKKVFRASRIGITESLYDFFSNGRSFPQILISGSAIGFYGDCADRQITEGDPAGAGFAAELCGDWEAAAQKFATVGTRVCLLRTGIVLGKGGLLAKMLPAFRLGGGGILGSGKQWMSWIQLNDLVRLIIHCLKDAQLAGPVNGVSPEPVTNGEFTRCLGRVLNRPTLVPAPRWLLDILFGDMAQELMLVSQRVTPQVAQAHGFVFRYPELTTALRASLEK